MPIHIFCDIQLSLKYIHTGQTEMLCSHLGNAYSILYIYIYLYSVKSSTEFVLCICKYTESK